MPSFTNKKALKFVITLQTGTFGSSNANTITLQGFRAIVDIDKAGGAMMGTLRAKIYGVSESDMNYATSLQWEPHSQIPNTVSVYAIDGTQQTLIFQGNIVNAWGNYQTMPDVFLEIQAQAAYHAQLQPVPPTSLKGAVDVATLMSQLAKNIGLTFENNGVSTTLSNPYLPGTATDQAKKLAQNAGIDLYIDDTVLAITPRYQPRAGLIPEISAQTGLVGYPSFTGFGVNFQMLFNPAVRFGGSINVVSNLHRANGQWVVSSIAHHLETEKPGGAWFSTVLANKAGLVVTK
jgi:hypothetical protein